MIWTVLKTSFVKLKLQKKIVEILFISFLKPSEVVLNFSSIILQVRFVPFKVKLSQQSRLQRKQQNDAKYFDCPRPNKKVSETKYTFNKAYWKKQRNFVKNLNRKGKESYFYKIT